MASTRRPSSAPRSRLRLIGGTLRGRHIEFTEEPGLRPTPDRVRETLFNWLQPLVTGSHCLDLFAGSGALGFEAASRGARRVVMVECDTAAARALQANRDLLAADTVEVVRADALEFIKHHRTGYDVVFLDPPFVDDCWPQLLALLPQCLKPGALVYCERAEALDAVPGWDIVKTGRAGQVSHQLLKRAEHEQ